MVAVHDHYDYYYNYDDVNYYSEQRFITIAMIITISVTIIVTIIVIILVITMFMMMMMIIVIIIIIITIYYCWIHHIMDGYEWTILGSEFTILSLVI